MDGIETGRREFAEEIDSLSDAAERVEQRVADFCGFLLLLDWEQSVDDVVMLDLELVNEGFVAVVALGGQGAYLNEGVCAAADGRCDKDSPVSVYRLGDDVHHF